MSMKMANKVLLCAALMGAAPAVSVVAQSQGQKSETSANEWNKHVNVVLKNATIREVFAEVKKQAKVNFMYSNDDAKHIPARNYNLRNKTIAEVIAYVIAGTDLTYEVSNNTIIIKRNVQSRQISGVIVDDAGVPIPGVAVAMKGTGNGTTTNMNGEFHFPATDKAEVKLNLSYLGMKSQTVAWRGRTLHVVMESDDNMLSEVVVQTGYQSVDKRKLTSAIQTIKMDDIKIAGINTVDQMLEGRVPGMIYMQNSGQMGATPKLRIRGNSTVIGSREPLWVLDGVVLSDPVNIDPSQLNDLDFVNLLGNAISGLNPDDIDQIDVLKDASATALYGPKAGNGVIVITTKKGKIGSPTVSYNTTLSFKPRSSYSNKAINLMNSKERIDVSRELIEKGIYYNNITAWTGYEKAVQDYYNGLIDYSEFSRQVGYYETVNTDWLGEICQNALSHNHTLGISGGSQNIRYYVSLGANNEQGTIKGESSKRYSTTMNLTANYEKFSAQFQLQGNVNDRNYNPSELNVLDYAYGMSRAVPLYNQDGTRYTYQRIAQTGYPAYNFNILNEMENSEDRTKGHALNMQAHLTYRIIPDLKVEGVLAYGVTSTNQRTTFTENSYYVHNLRRDFTPAQDQCPIGGELRDNNITNTTWMARIQASYMKFLDSEKKHNISFSAGSEWNSSKYDGFNITRRGYYRDRGEVFASVPTTYGGYYNQFMTTPAALGQISKNLQNNLAWYGIAGYDYDNRYMVNLHLRGEDSNLFGTRANQTFMPIWAVSARWNIKRDVLQKTKWIDDLSLRASFGYQGNMLSGQTPYMIIRQGTDYMNKYGETNSMIVNYPNPDLKWEKTASSNASLDFSFLRGKINGSLSYYYKRTTDAFLTKNISEINGITQYVVNSGTLVNQGVEIALNFVPINNIGAQGGKRGFTWRIDPQLGTVFNELINKAINSRNNILRDEITYSDMLNGNVEFAGRPLNSFYSYKFNGLSAVDGSPMFLGAEDENQEELAKKYNNLQREDVYLAVMEYSGRREPYIQGGISNYFGYRNFGLSFNLTYSLGNKIRLMKICSQYATTMPDPSSNLRREYLDRWQKPGDEAFTNIPALNTNPSAHSMPWWRSGVNYVNYSFANNIYEMYDNSNIRVVSGNYLRLSSLSLRYNVEDELCKHIGLKSAYVSLTGTNLFTIASKALNGQDPTQSGSAPSIAMATRPSYTVNLNVTF